MVVGRGVVSIEAGLQLIHNVAGVALGVRMKKQSLNQIRIAVMNAKGRLMMHVAEITPHPEDSLGRNWDTDSLSKRDPKWGMEIERLRSTVSYDPSLD